MKGAANIMNEQLRTFDKGRVLDGRDKNNSPLKLACCTGIWTRIDCSEGSNLYNRICSWYLDMPHVEDSVQELGAAPWA
jgi:hypothetical protein